MNTKIIKEGNTEVFVPVPDENHNYPPSSTPVFYNPKMELCRDINIACISTFSKGQNLSYIDTLAATGIMGIRVANEVRDGIFDVTINDFSKSAYELIQKNVQMIPEPIRKDVYVQRQNAITILSKRKYDIVDIDPFGSPTPFLDVASQSAEQFLCVTATDTAPLCGAHKNSGIRKYGAIPLKTEYHKEMGVRVLLGKILRDLISHDKSGKPLLSFATRHFVRTYLQIEKSAKKADDCLKNIGFILHCFSCGFRSYKHGLAVFLSQTCPVCQNELSLAGPLYLGKIHEKNFCSKVLCQLETLELGTYKKAVKIVETCSKELDIPFYYDHHVICKSLKVTPTTLDELILELKKEGFIASKTHFSGTSFKTDAKIDSIKKIIMEIKDIK